MDDPVTVFLFEVGKKPWQLRSESPRCLTIKQAAQYLGSSVWHIRNLCWSGELPHIKAGKRIVIDRKDLLD